MSNSLNVFRDNANNNGPDFGYDAYGNMTSDANKRIQSIAYNHLNLPTVINFQNNGGHIRYTYDALGVKVRKAVDELANNTITTTDYLDGFQYRNEALVFFPTAEGYVEFATPTKFFYVYNYTDHLGNVRMSYTENGTEPKILEESHYYPFGLKHENYASEVFERISEPNGELFVIQPTERREWQYKYNGKEWQDELGLNFYDYGARNYDAAIGRWMNVDPLAEKYFGISAYSYAIDNPIVFIDPDGNQVDTSWIYERDKEGNQNKALIKAFEAFAKTKEGIAFLGNFASKGQVIAGHKYSESGKFDVKNIDLSFGAVDLEGADATTKATIRNDGSLDVKIGLSDSGTMPDIYLIDIGHEGFVHAEKHGEDFSDNGKLDLSNLDKDIVKQVTDAGKKDGYYKRYRTSVSQHLQAQRDKTLEMRLLPMVRDYNKNTDGNRTDATLKRMILKYQL